MMKKISESESTNDLHKIQRLERETKILRESLLQLTNILFEMAEEIESNNIERLSGYYSALCEILDRLEQD